MALSSLAPSETSHGQQILTHHNYASNLTAVCVGVSGLKRTTWTTAQILVLLDTLVDDSADGPQTYSLRHAT